MDKEKIHSVALAFWRLFFALFFYPIMIVLFLWLYIKDAHWMFGLGVIGLILFFDRTWWVILKAIINWRPKKSLK